VRPMQTMVLIAAILAFGLFVYLLVALLSPETFE
jgi:K+-transporting ATPase KdpF subunit